jgi:hypothetical protein
VGQAGAGEVETGGEDAVIPMLAEIERILLREWDPIGVDGIPEAADEYDRYAFELYVKLQSPTCPSIHEIEAYLNWVQTERMGLKLTADRNHQAAAMIAGL